MVFHCWMLPVLSDLEVTLWIYLQAADLQSRTVKPLKWVTKDAHILTYVYECLYVPVKSKLQHPPRATPQTFEFLENLCSNSPFPRLKSCLNAPTCTCLWGRRGGLFPLTVAGNRAYKIIVYIVKTILIHLHI